MCIFFQYEHLTRFIKKDMIIFSPLIETSEIGHIFQTGVRQHIFLTP